MTRNGKIARLPRKLREELNLRLRDGEMGTHLIAWLNELAEVKAVLKKEFCGRLINAQNLSDWKQGGFEDWLRHQEALSFTQHRTEEAEELMAASGESSGANHVSELTALALGIAVRQILSGSLATPKERRELQELAREVTMLRRCDQSALHLQMEREKWDQQLEEAERRQARDDMGQENLLRHLAGEAEKQYYKDLKKGPLSAEQREKYRCQLMVTGGPNHPLAISLRPPESAPVPGPNQDESR